MRPKLITHTTRLFSLVAVVLSSWVLHHDELLSVLSSHVGSASDGLFLDSLLLDLWGLLSDLTVNSQTVPFLL